MKDRVKSDEIAELAIVDYVELLMCTDNEDITKALELLISKSSLAIKKYAGVIASKEVLQRTIDNLNKKGN